MLKKNDIINITITDLTSEASGVGRYDGMAIFVPMTAIGDEVSVRIVKVLKNYSFGIIEKIITPSSNRIEVDCPIFKRCGGCDFRHISYESELSHKGHRVEEIMKRIGGIDLNHPSAIATPLVDRYRNKAIYPIKMQNDKLVIGFFANRSHEVIDCSDCMLHPAFFKDIVEAVKEFITQNKISMYDETTYQGLVRSLYIRNAAITNQVMVCLIINGECLPKQDKFIEKMLCTNSNIASIVLNVNTDKTNVLLGEKCINIHGSQNINDTLCGLKFEISPLSFYQINRDGAEKLYAVVKDFAELGGEETVLDLYCGAGTIGLSMASDIKKLIGVDIVEPAVENARQNSKNNNIHNAEFYCDDAAKAAVMLKENNVMPDIVIIDPPRKGCEASLINTMVEMNPKKIIMVSCDPATAARDVALLEKQGYNAVRIQAVDMFARTKHVETVVLLSHKKSQASSPSL